MDGKDSDQLQFRGRDGTECNNFIAALLKLAFAQEKQRDDQWIAHLAATCMAGKALVWWSALDEEVQGSWKLLRVALLSEYGSIFSGGSGEEAEDFVRAVHRKAIDEGKRRDNEWIVAYAESCFAGDALRWYAQLDSDTQENWKKLQKALLAQYPRDGAASPALNLVPTPPAAASLAPTPKVPGRRGRIRVSNPNSSKPHYLSKVLPSGNRLCTTESLADALELEWSTGSDGLSTLSIPGSQIPGYDLLGLKWNADKSQSTSYPNHLGFCAVNSQTNSTSITGYGGNLSTSIWDISTQGGRSDGLLTLSAKTEKKTRYPQWSATFIWFSENITYASYPHSEFFFEPI